MGKTTKLHRVNTYLTDNEKALLEQLAKQRGLTLSALLRTMVLREAAGLIPAHQEGVGGSAR